MQAGPWELAREGSGPATQEAAEGRVEVHTGYCCWFDRQIQDRSNSCDRLLFVCLFCGGKLPKHERMVVKLGETVSRPNSQVVYPFIEPD